MVLLHSFTGSSRDMRLLANDLNAAGYAVQAPIFSGHADKTPLGPLSFGPDRWLAETQAAVRAMRREYGRVVTFGLSMGGNFALRALETMAGVVAGGAFATPLVDGSPHFARTVHRYMDYIVRESDQQADFGAAQGAIEHQRAALRHLAHLTIAAAPSVHVPVLLAQGGQDTVITPQTALRSLALFRGAPASLAWYPEANHILTADPHSQAQLSRDVLAFLARL
ncbi:hypothetical protein FD19_GL000689 [Lacticaseibacillus thailandensis DSM 22698 = JCM 13996]|uniref:Serine aminopeptidase S33 domain-containing protein n=1 Tax=Lacticaseibacillus thailandensis DSM 22698 = JCM 13996 TaxID=1423810 RepID=A0A0R2CIZ0_9LACO|nr:hypothetical protein FD19_GL000689 [Lacticaseibacillus thailandensis DSM 22698 = JCM 13996]